MNPIRIIFFTCILVLSLSCQNRQKERAEKNTIAVSIAPLRFFVEQIAENDVKTVVIVPPGASAETFEPSIQSIKDVFDSKLFIATALLEPEHNIINAVQNDVEILSLKDSIDIITDTDCCGNHNHAGDPHIWLSVKNARVITRLICQQLCNIIPDSCEKYIRNRDLLLNKIDTLDRYWHEQLSKDVQKTVIIYHPALGYLAQEYGFTQLSIEHNGKEPDSQTIKSIIDNIQGKNIKNLLYQAEFSDETVQSIAKTTGTTAIKIDPLSDNWLENMYSLCRLIAPQQ